MQRIQISLCSPHTSKEQTVTIEAFDVSTALLITDINVSFGNAELWHEGRRLGRLTKYGGKHGTFWGVG